MLPRSSRSVAPLTERPVLAPSWLIVLLAGLVGGGLWLLYPRQDLERRLQETTDSALSVTYLHNLLRSDPDNPRLRLLLAQRQIAQGDLADARATLQPALNATSPELHREALWKLWELSYAEYRQTPETDTARREVLRADLHSQLRALAQEDWPVERQMQLAKLTAQFNDSALGIELSRKMATAQPNPREAAQLYERAARESLAISDYAGCAQLYLLARKTTPDPQQAKIYFHAAVSALQSGNQPVAALELGQKEIGELADDPATLLLMTQLARAAGRPAVADQYVRRLLRLALLQWRWPGEAALADGPTEGAQPVATTYDDGAHLLQPPRFHTATATAQGDSADPAAWRLFPMAQARPPAATPLGLPFDDKIYTLGYEVFLENQKPEDAWLVAHAAVQQQPQNLVWRERLARVSDWTQRPAVALEHWLFVARQTQRPDAWQAVLRLAPGQFDDAALIQALRYQLSHQPDALPLIRELVAAYERIGEPQPAIDYLRQQARSPETLELLADLAERAGQADAALESWRRLLSLPAQATPERAMRAAVLALLHGHPDEGLRWLESAQQYPPNKAVETDYWRLTGQLAENRQRNALAIEAYRRLLGTQDIDSSDFDALIRMLLQDQPLEAAQVSAHAWERFDEPRHLVQALTLYANRNRWEHFQGLLRQIDPAPQAQRRALHRLWKLPEFLRLVGTYHQQTGQLTEARRHFEAGLRLNPGSSAMRQALLWLFIYGNDTTSLRTLLATRELDWRADEDMHDALASAYQALSLPQTALDRYLTPRLQSHQRDFLWLMNYADALDQNQQGDRAWRLRRHLLSQEWQTARQGDGGQRLSPAEARRHWLTQEGLEQTRRIARTRLMLTQRPGDAALDVLRELLRLDRDAQDGLSNAAAETAIGWLQDAGEYTAERGFLWHQYARTHSLRANRPLWADITVALAEDDKAAAGQLLQAFDERLPRYDRVNAARAVGDLRLAQTAAFEALHNQHDDQPLHLQLGESLLAFSDHAGAKLAHEQLGGMNENRASETLHLALSPRLSLDLGHERILRRATDANVIRDAPNETALQAQLSWRHPDGETTLRAARRESMVVYTPLEIEHEQRIDNRLALRVALGSDLPSQESLALRVAGMKSRAALSLRYQATRQDQVLLTHWGERYALQTGASVGSSRNSSINYTHTYRMETPQLEFGAFWSTHDFKRKDLSDLGPRDQGFRRYLPAQVQAPGPDYFLPERFRFYGVQISTNMRHAQEYTRAWQPFASVSRTWHSRQGPGYGLRLGLAGSLLGADHLSLSWGMDKSGLQSQSPTRTLQLNYRLHF